MAEKRPTIDDIAFVVEKVPEVPDQQDRSAERTLEQARVDHLEQQIEDLKSFRDLRSKYAKKVYLFMVAWSAGVLTLLFIQGFRPAGFELSVPTMSTLVGGTTVSVVGLVGFIIRGLFADANGK